MVLHGVSMQIIQIFSLWVVRHGHLDLLDLRLILVSVTSLGHTIIRLRGLWGASILILQLLILIQVEVQDVDLICLMANRNCLIVRNDGAVWFFNGRIEAILLVLLLIDRLLMHVLLLILVRLFGLGSLPVTMQHVLILDVTLKSVQVL